MRNQNIATSAAILLAVVTVAFAFTPGITQQQGLRNAANTHVVKHNVAHYSSTSSSSLSMGLKTSVLSQAVTKASSNPVTTTAAVSAIATTAAVKFILDRPSRTYSSDSVAREYDAWTADGILEYYWGEHIHLGYYNEHEMKAGYKKKDFIQAKYDFIDEMMTYGGINAASDSGAKVLDVGCGFGGTSRYLADKLGPSADVTGITLSPNQVKRGTELAIERGLTNTKFVVMNALEMDFPDNSFDIVWACESGEHMPDKEAYINEMMRVLKPGGKFVMATWCQRDDRTVPFDEKDKRDLRFLYEEW
jgi:MPBQ/MSBQ methyltransferase